MKPFLQRTRTDGLHCLKDQDQAGMETPVRQSNNNSPYLILDLLRVFWEEIKRV